MKKFYAIITICSNRKYYTWGMPFSQSDNIMSKLRKLPEYSDITTVFVVGTRREMRDIVTDYNNSYRRNGTALFDFGFFEEASV